MVEATIWVKCAPLDAVEIRTQGLRIYAYRKTGPEQRGLSQEPPLRKLGHRDGRRRQESLGLGSGQIDVAAGDRKFHQLGRLMDPELLHDPLPMLFHRPNAHA